MTCFMFIMWALIVGALVAAYVEWIDWFDEREWLEILCVALVLILTLPFVLSAVFFSWLFHKINR